MYIQIDTIYCWDTYNCLKYSNLIHMTGEKHAKNSIACYFSKENIARVQSNIGLLLVFVIQNLCFEISNILYVSN